MNFNSYIVKTKNGIDIDDYISQSFLRSESCRSHLRDVYKDSVDRFLPDRNENTDLRITVAEPKKKQHDFLVWWNQNLLLFIEIAGVTGSILKWRSGRLATKVYSYTIKITSE